MDNPALQDCQESNGFGDMMDEDVMNNVSVRLKLSLTIWDFTLPVTPSLPAVFGVSWQYSFLLCSISVSVLCNCYGSGCNELCLMCLLGPAEPAAGQGCCCYSQTSSRDTCCAIEAAVFLAFFIDIGYTDNLF